MSAAEFERVGLRYVAAPEVREGSCRGCAFADDSEGCSDAGQCTPNGRDDGRAIVWKLAGSAAPAQPVHAWLAADPAGYLVVVAEDSPDRPSLKPYPVYTRPPADDALLRQARDALVALSMPMGADQCDVRNAAIAAINLRLSAGAA